MMVNIIESEISTEDLKNKIREWDISDTWITIKNVNLNVTPVVIYLNNGNIVVQQYILYTAVIMYTRKTHGGNY